MSGAVIRTAIVVVIGTKVLFRFIIFLCTNRLTRLFSSRGYIHWLLTRCSTFDNLTLPTRRNTDRLLIHVRTNIPILLTFRCRISQLSSLILIQGNTRRSLIYLRTSRLINLNISQPPTTLNHGRIYPAHETRAQDNRQHRKQCATLNYSFVNHVSTTHRRNKTQT